MSLTISSTAARQWKQCSARSQAPDSASAQFYIALKPLPELDGRYAVFGRVTEGLDVVDAIRQDDKIIKATVLTPGL